MPLEKVAIDILGPLPMTDNGNQYILVFGDYYTKWTEAYALPDQTAQRVADCVMDFICHFGCPRQIHSDQGRNFESDPFQQMCTLMQVHKTRTTPYRPQSDGLVERFNRTLQQMLSMYVNDRRYD